MDSFNISKYIEHTNLNLDAEMGDIKSLCDEAVKYNFSGVCVRPENVFSAWCFLGKSGVNVVSVIGFPKEKSGNHHNFGSTSTLEKISEIEESLTCGANEIDFVMNVGKFKDEFNKPEQNLSYVFEEIQSAVLAVRNAGRDIIFKLIIETGFLSDEEIKTACEIAELSGCDYVKTSTGYGIRGASLEDIKIMKSSCDLKIKAAGGIKNYFDAKKFIEAGAEKIGTSSGVKIINDALE